LDYDVITETTSIDHALSIIISLYVIFELQFGAHNRMINLLYGILLQEPAALTKQLRSLLKEWNFQIDKKERNGNTQLVPSVSPKNKKPTTPMENLAYVKDSQADDLIDSDEHEDLIEKTPSLHSIQDERYELSIFPLLGDAQNPTTSTAYGGNKELMDTYSTATQQSSTSSSPVDSQLVINIPSPEKQQILPMSRDRSSKEPQKIISVSRKRRSSPESPISSRLKRSRTKQKQF
jgi:hypothetical protein